MRGPILIIVRTMIKTRIAPNPRDWSVEDFAVFAASVIRALSPQQPFNTGIYLCGCNRV